MIKINLPFAGEEKLARSSTFRRKGSVRWRTIKEFQRLKDHGLTQRGLSCDFSSRKDQVRN